MERSAAVGKTVLAFVNWEEVCSTSRRGRKEVRFYLKRRDGTYDLAVIGKEKKLGHNTKASSFSPYRYRYARREQSLFLSLNLRYKLPSKLRSRREVIDCLNSIVSDGSFPLPPQPLNGLFDSGHTLRLNSERIEDTHLHKTGGHATESVWVGSAWTCRKKRKHFEAYTRSGVRISVQDFVYVLAEGSKHLVAYINDLYEDSRGNKTAVVQWFHKIDELGSEIEVLSQDSGIRGVWFKAVVIKKHKDKLKVRYQDIKDAADESINLEEWILSSRVAVADELGIRHGGRMTIRPTQLANKIDVCSIDVGCVVDAWLHDGWWEGIVVHKESDDRIHVYFPGEKNRSVLGCKDLRYSQEWLGDSWKKMEDRPDILGLISCATETNLETTKSSDNVSSLSSEGNREIKVDLLGSLTWNWSTKKRRSRCKNNKLVAVGTRKRDSYPMPVSVKVDCKFTCARVASPLTRLVLSR